MTYEATPMSESATEQEQCERREFEGKNIAHYSVLLQAWVDTRMERDRTIVALSAAGVALVVTILTTIGPKHAWEMGFYGGAVAGFVLAIAVSLFIFHRNSAHIEEAIRGSSKNDPLLEKFDSIHTVAFLAGVILLAIVGVASAFHTLNEESSMNDKTKTSSMLTQGILTGDSINGIGALAPADVLKKSLSGIGTLKPQAAQPATNQNQSTGQSGPATQGNSGAAATQHSTAKQK